MLVHFFIFKQKTAYELRISDWSSDVCSSDLAISLHDFLGFLGVFLGHLATGIALVLTHFLPRLGIVLTSFLTRGTIATVSIQNAGIGLGRSEEHTSELQSLMRISYAVFCLKKKQITINQIYPQSHNTPCEFPHMRTQPKQ